MILYHLPDFQKNLKLNLVFLDYFKYYRRYFQDNMSIECIYDSFPLIWNGGRFVPGETDFETARKTISEINKRGVRVAFTFTNSLLEEKHLSDPAANRIMEIAAESDIKNLVIVNSPLLENYIRDRYPEFGLVLSTTRQIGSLEELNRQLEKDYETVVLDYNMNHDEKVLNGIIRKEKCEFLVNACCRDDCPDRGAHYRYISRQQINNSERDDNSFPGQQNPGGKMPNWKCSWGKYDYFTFRNFRNFISREEIEQKYEPMGFSHFKIEGRGGYTLHLLEVYVQYMVKPEFRDQVRYELHLRIF